MSISVESCGDIVSRGRMMVIIKRQLFCGCSVCEKADWIQTGYYVIKKIKIKNKTT